MLIYFKKNITSLKMKQFIFTFTILLVPAYAQLSLDQMVDKLKQENTLVFNSAGPPGPPTSQVQNSQTSSGASIGNRFEASQSGVPIDSRFDQRASHLVSTKILQLAQEIIARSRNDGVKNNILSPMSIAGALALVLLGANGQTFNELLRLFGFDQDETLRSYPYKIHEEFGLLIEDLLSDYPNPSRPRPLNHWKYMTPSSVKKHQFNQNDNPSPSEYHQVYVANAIFNQKGYSLRPSYQAAVNDVYRSEVVQLDFRANTEGAKKYINDWVRARTRGKIDQIVGSEIDSSTNLIIASSLYFKAIWDQTFLEGATNKKQFYPNGLGTDPILVDMMAHGGEFPFYDAKEYDCRILGFPYKGNLTTMYIILPNNSTRQRLRELQAFLTPERIEDMISKMVYKTAIILFPKLHIQNTLDLKSIFQRLGLRTLFEPSQSDLSLMSTGRTMNFSNMKAPAASFVATNPVDPKIPVFQPEFPKRPPNSYQESIATLPTDPTIPVFQPDVGNRNQPLAIQTDNLQSQLVFTRFGPDSDFEMQSDQPQNVSRLYIHTYTPLYRGKRAVTYKVESNYQKELLPLRYKDFLINKRIVKQKAEKKLIRGRRQVQDPSASLKQLDQLRNSPMLRNPALYADAIVHKIDLTVNEKGTEGGAATAAYLTRTGTDVVFRTETPFLLLIRHDATRLPLFYGAIFEPTV